jgi:hypothetical protein
MFFGMIEELIRLLPGFNEAPTVQTKGYRIRRLTKPTRSQVKVSRI